MIPVIVRFSKVALVAAGRATHRVTRPTAILATFLGASGLGVMPLMPAIAGAAESSASTPTVTTVPYIPKQDLTQFTLAQGTVTATNVQLDNQLVDASGAIDDAEKQKIIELLRKGIKEKETKLYLVFVNSMPTDPQAYAQQLRQQDATRNTMVLVVDTQKRQFGSNWGEGVSTSLAKEIQENAVKHFADSEWTAGAQAAADTVAGTTSPASLAWLSAAGVAVVGGGAGAVVWSRKRRKKQETQQLEVARNIKPEDTVDLVAQPTSTLRALAEEKLRTTDNSIRKGQEELRLAISEFGEQRTRSLSLSVGNSRATLDSAYRLHQRIRDGLASNEDEERALLIEIISTCGKANKLLDNRSSEFAEMRDELIHAPKMIEELWQETIALRTRIPAAQDKLHQLKDKYGDLMVSLDDNPDVAEKAIEEAEKAIATAREIKAQPAGKQSGLVDAMAAAKMACQQADNQITAIEKAEEQLAAAQRNVKSLIKEVESEIKKSEELLASEAEFDHTALQQAMQHAQTTLHQAKETSHTDPLSAYTALLHADGQLDIQIALASDADDDLKRAKDVFFRQEADIKRRLAGVEATINNRAQIIGLQARSSLEEAKSLLRKAVNQQLLQDRLPTLQAANRKVTDTERLVQQDIDDFNRRNSNHGGGNGDLITGLLLGSLFSGHGGFGSSFGGGFGGGDFGGGGDSGSF